MGKISAVINVIPEEIPYLTSLFPSIVGFVDDISVIDMTGGDENLKALCEKYNAVIFPHKFVPYVEAVRNYGLSKARADWTLILDPDEEIPSELAARLTKIAESSENDYYRLPRKNMIFGKWMQHSRYWPDYNIRFFRRGHVMWDDKIHSVPVTKGKGKDIEPREELAILHHHYTSLTQFLARMDRYTSIQALELERKKYRFIWVDLVRRPTSEFLSRYFAGEGYKDGLHGLALSLLQSFSECLLYLKMWEREKFMEQGITPLEIAKEVGYGESELNFWITDMLIKSKNILASLPLRVKRKLLRRKK